MSPRPHLKVIEGGRQPLVTFGLLQVYLDVFTTRSSSLVDVEVVEEDTWQVLSAENVALEVDEHPIRLMTSLIDQQPLAAGDVLKARARWRLVTADFDAEPVTMPEDIKTALEHLLEEVRRNRVRSISMPLLGVSHGHVSAAQSTAILIDTLHRFQHDTNCRIYLRLAEEHTSIVRDQLLTH